MGKLLMRLFLEIKNDWMDDDIDCKNEEFVNRECKVGLHYAVCTANK